MMRRALPCALAACLIAGGAARAQPAPQPPLDPPPAPSPQLWQPRGRAELRLLNKVDAHVAPLSLAVGQGIRIGKLSIALRACVARPPDEIADSAAYLVVRDDRLPGQAGAGTDPAGDPSSDPSSDSGTPPLFEGWMLAREPQLSVMEHPIFNLRLLDCR